MGAYLSEPMTAKQSEDGEGNRLKFGSCSMQGWRVSQEDAHNCIANFDEDSSFFAVYDGHGGAEVAIYLSRHLPEVLKSCSAYKNGEFIKALEECYLKIDESITTPEVIKEIQQIAKCNNGENEATVDYEDENVGALYEEATMPLDKLVAKYQSGGSEQVGEDVDSDCKPGSSKSIGSSASPGSSKPLSNEAAGSLSSVEEKEKVNGENGEPEAVDEEPASCSASAKHTKTEGKEAEEVVSTTKLSDNELIVEGKQIQLHKQDESEVCSNSNCKEDKPSGSCSTSKSDSQPVSSTVNGEESKPDKGEKASEEAEAKSSGMETEKEATPNGSSSSEPAKSAGGSEAETPRRKKTHPLPVPMDSSKPERRSPRKSQQALKNFDCSDSDESDEDDDGYNEVDSSDSDEEMGDEEETSDEDDDDEYEDEDEADERFLNDIQEPGYDSGSTAVVCFMKWEADSLSLWVANAGDSRCVVCREGKAVDMSHDHKPELDVEAQRIVKAGGKVTDDGRVNGGLNLSRALGDHSYKQNKSLPPEEQMISPLPSVEHIVLNPTKDKFIVLACDGVWNSMTSQEVVDFVDARLERDESLSKICEELFDACLAPDTCGDGTGCDNMTAVIVKLSDSPQIVSGSKRRFSTENAAEVLENMKKSRVD